jgi:hypothetical protein
MDDAQIRAALARYWANLEHQQESHALYHEDAVLEFPQGNEQFVGLQNVRGMREAYPADVRLTLQRLRGSGALWIGEVLATYDGGPPAHGVCIMEFRDGQVIRETIYFGEPWESPAWRAPWVEPMPAIWPTHDPTS